MRVCQIQVPKEQEDSLAKELSEQTSLVKFAEQCAKCDAEDMGSFWILAAAMAKKSEKPGAFWGLIQSYGEYVNEFAQYLTIRYIKGSFLIRATEYLKTVAEQLEQYLKK